MDYLLINIQNCQFGFSILSKLFETTSHKDRSKALNQDADMLTLKYLSISASINTIIEDVNIQKSQYNYHFSLSPLVREQLEHYAAFHHIFINSINEERMWAKYLAWVIAGIQTRTVGISTRKMSNVLKNRVLEEEKFANECIDALKNTGDFLRLNENQANHLLNNLKKRKWEVDFSGDRVQFLSMDDLCKRVLLKEGTWDNVYRLLSLSSHPNYVSVIQIRELQDNFIRRKEFIANTIGLSSFFTCLFISAYCKYFKSAQIMFNTLTIRERQYVNSILEEFGGVRFTI